MKTKDIKANFLSVLLNKNETRINYSIMAAIGLVSAGIILAEISLTRLFSVTIWYHFSFVAISLVMLGLAGSAVFVHVFIEKWGLEKLERLLPIFSLLGGFFSILSLAIYLSINYTGTFMENSGSIYRLIPTLLFIPVFYMGGIVICALIARHAANVNKLYFSDLLCAGLAGASSIFLFEKFSGPLVFVIAGVFITLSACLLPISSGEKQKKNRIWPFIGLLLFILFVFIFNSLSLFEMKYTKDYDETQLKKVYEKWSALSRITVFENTWSDGKKPFGWGLSKKYKGPRVDELWIEQDAGAGSPIINSDGNIKKLDFLDYDITAAAYAMVKPNKVAVIGLGGGRDVMLAMKHDATDIVGIEINKDIADLVTDKFADFVGHVFNRESTRIIIADGRTYMEQTQEKFDLIQISLTDSFTASSAGAYVLAENNLYTLQAFETYLNRLNDKGILTVSRWVLKKNPGETIRMVTLTLEALKRKGIQYPPNHIAVVRGEYIGNLLVKSTPFTHQELNKIKSYCKAMAFEILYMPEPGRWLSSIQNIINNWDNLPVYLNSLRYDYSAPTDDRPFFFFVLKPWEALTFGAFSSDALDAPLKGNYTAIRTLYVMFFILVVIVLLIVIFPAFQMKKKQNMTTSPWASGFLFMLLGLGFMLIEIPLLQRLALILGHPIYALSVVLSTLLVSTGIGAAFSKKLIFHGNAPAKRLGVALLIVSTLIFMFFIATNLLSHRILTLGEMTRFSFSILLVAACGFGMGLPFPSIIMALKQRGDEKAIPWLWAVNGAASVMGSVFAFAAAIFMGFTFTVALGCLCYLIVANMILKLKV